MTEKIMAKNGKEATCILQPIEPPSERYTYAGVSFHDGKYQIHWCLKKEDRKVSQK